jgi:hypothetical protein
VCGVVFHIRKINPLDYVAGTTAMQMHFDTYKTKSQKEQLTAFTAQSKKLKAHFSDVFMAAVVQPKLSRKKDDEGIPVDNLFTDWDLANGLYVKIMQVTYGKKKFRSIISQNSALSKLTS